MFVMSVVAGAEPRKGILTGINTGTSRESGWMRDLEYR